MVQFCALGYVSRRQGDFRQGPEVTIALALRERGKAMKLILRQDWRLYVEAGDLGFMEALVEDLSVRATLDPEGLFKQLCSLNVGPLVTHTLGSDVSHFPRLLEFAKQNEGA